MASQRSGDILLVLENVYHLTHCDYCGYRMALLRTAVYLSYVVHGGTPDLSYMIVSKVLDLIRWWPTGIM